MSTHEAARSALGSVASIPRDDEGPVFPTPWAARAFALAVALNERGAFTWTEWSEALGRNVAVIAADTASDPEAYWHAWLATLEEMLAGKDIAGHTALVDLQEAWRRAAEATPHGQPIELAPHRQA